MCWHCGCNSHMQCNGLSLREFSFIYERWYMQLVLCRVGINKFPTWETSCAVGIEEGGNRFKLGLEIRTWFCFSLFSPLYIEQGIVTLETGGSKWKKISQAITQRNPLLTSVDVYLPYLFQYIHTRKWVDLRPHCFRNFAFNLRFTKIFPWQ